MARLSPNNNLGIVIVPVADALNYPQKYLQ